MIKYISLFVFVFFLSVACRLYAQTAPDTSASAIIADSLVKEANDSSGNPDESETSQVLPISDSNYSFSDTVRKVSAHQVRSYLLNPDYAYANDPEYWRKEQPGKPGPLSRLFFNKVFRYILLVAVIALVLFGIYQLAKENNFSWLLRRGNSKSPDESEEVAEENMDYGLLIKKYQDDANYRMAVRYLYLRLIQNVKEKSGIHFGDSSTNAEITRAFGSHPRAADFRFLAMAYEYIYYGGFVASPVMFDTIRNKFENFEQSFSV